MGKIFSLSGSKAVGKTTLINGLRDTIPQLQIREGFRQTETGYSLDIEEEFYINQRWYIEREIEEYYSFKKNEKPALLLRGPEDVEFYTLHYPFTKGYKWNVEKNLHTELERLRKCRSDYIIYLDAPVDTIIGRKQNDITKPRKNMQNWMEWWQPYIDIYMKAFDNTYVYETKDKAANEVLEEITRWIKKRM